MGIDVKILFVDRVITPGQLLTSDTEPIILVDGCEPSFYNNLLSVHSHILTNNFTGGYYLRVSYCNMYDLNVGFNSNGISFSSNTFQIFNPLDSYLGVDSLAGMPIFLRGDAPFIDGGNSTNLYVRAFYNVVPLL